MYRLADPLQQARAEQGLCYRCGKAREHERYRLCQGCREYMSKAVARSRAKIGRLDQGHGVSSDERRLLEMLRPRPSFGMDMEARRRRLAQGGA